MRLDAFEQLSASCSRTGIVPITRKKTASGKNNRQRQCQRKIEIEENARKTRKATQCDRAAVGLFWASDWANSSSIHPSCPNFDTPVFFRVITTVWLPIDE